MSEKAELTKSELMTQIDDTWAALQAVLGQLTDAQFVTQKDAAGWTVKDHVIHLAAWERSVLYLLQSRPRHSGLGISESLYLSGDFDQINAAIVERSRDLPADAALAELRHGHQQLMATLEPLSEAELVLPYSAYLPDEVGDGEGPPVINLVFGNTAHHFAEHLPWIEALVSR